MKNAPRGSLTACLKAPLTALTLGTALTVWGADSLTDYFKDGPSSDQIIASRLMESQPSTPSRSELTAPVERARPHLFRASSGSTGFGEFWASIGTHEFASSGEIMCADDHPGVSTEHFFGRTFEFKKGPPVLVMDSLVATDRSKMALIDELNERLIINDRFALSQSQGVIWAPFKNKDIEFNMKDFKRITLSVRF